MWDSKIYSTIVARKHRCLYARRIQCYQRKLYYIGYLYDRMRIWNAIVACHQTELIRTDYRLMQLLPGSCTRLHPSFSVPSSNPFLDPKTQTESVQQLIIITLVLHEPYLTKKNFLGTRFLLVKNSSIRGLMGSYIPYMSQRSYHIYFEGYIYIRDYMYIYIMTNEVKQVL